MNRIRLVARLAWVLPVFLFGLALHQAKVAYDLQQTIDEGTPATAEVLELHQENRVDVTYDYISLRATLPGGETLTREKMALPHALAPRLEGKETVEVLVNRGASQDMVVASIARTQRGIAAMNAGISGIACLLFGAGVFFWNRHLARHGDPSRRAPDDDPRGEAEREAAAQEA
jgi:hypothetical protein